MLQSAPLLARVSDLVADLRVEVRAHDTEHPVFHGCWDWHSAVHGHWGLLVASEMIGSPADQDWVTERLLGSGMKQELETLKHHPAFERPYGRAWLLRLVLAFEQITGNQALRQPIQEVASHLRDWLASVPLGPDVPEYGNPSWALLQLYSWADHVRDEDTCRWVKAAVEQDFLGTSIGLMLDHDPPGGFFSQWGVQATLIGSVLGDGTLAQWLDRQSISSADLVPVQTLHSAHHLAIHAARAWGFAAAARATGEQRWSLALTEHIEAALALHGPWRHDRRAYTHWVPQFTLYALVLAGQSAQQV